MTKSITNVLTALSFLLFMSFTGLSTAGVITSAQSGLFSEGSTWVGGLAPAPGDDIIISSGHTVTLDNALAEVKNITINTGAILDNSTYPLTIYSTTPGANPVYTNNGTHNGTGNLVLYDGNNTEISGSGVLNCNMEIRSFGVSVKNTCSLTLNGNIQHSVPGNNGMESKYLIDASQVGGILTVNGSIITDEQYMVGITTVPGTTIVVTGDVLMPGGLSSGSGSNITNGGTFQIGGDLLLGPFSGYCQNTGTMVIGGDLLGSVDTYFIQEIGASVSFGGAVFPASNDGLLFGSESPLLGPSIPNTIVYNGTAGQVIKFTADAGYADLVINNSNAVALVDVPVTIFGNLTVKSGAALTVDPAGSLSVTGTILVESNATGTGSLIMDTPATIAFDRYIEGYTDANHGWHFLSSPVSAQPISAFHTPGTGNDFYKWDEPTGVWINRTDEGGGLNASFETNFVVGTGYLMANASTGTSQFAGIANTADVSVTGLTNSVLNTNYAGWNLLGNPFSSAVQWNNGDWALNNIDANCQIWNEENASYSVVGPNQIIPATNGFMVHAAANNASLVIPTSARTHSNTPWYKSTMTEDQITLTVFDYEGNTAQPTMVRFDDLATEAYDTEYDSYFLSGFAPQFYSTSSDVNFALNTLPDFTVGSSIPMGFLKNSSSSFTMMLTENSGNHQLYLEDKKTGSIHLLNSGSYTFSSVEGDDAQRFQLHFGTVGRDELAATEPLNAWMANGSLHIRNSEPGVAYLYDLQGRKLRSFTVNTTSLYSTSIDLNPGIYMLNMQSKSGTRSVKLLAR